MAGMVLKIVSKRKAASQVIADLHKKGISLTLVGKGKISAGPAENLTDDIRDLIRENKYMLIWYLSN